MALPLAVLAPVAAGALALGKEVVGGLFAKEIAQIALKEAVVNAIPKVAGVAGAAFIAKQFCDVAKNANDFNFEAKKGDANIHMNAKNKL